MFRKWFQKKTGQQSWPIQARQRPRLAVEQLEDRQLPSASYIPGQDMTDLARMYPAPHSGPTILYLNFDGGNFYGQSISAFQPASGLSKDQAIQDILYRVSELFAPFNVEVERIYGAGNFSQSNGNTTVFIGGVASDNGWSHEVTEPSSMDFPGAYTNNGHRPNSNPYDVAFVDPGFYTPETFPGATDNATAAMVAEGAGNTFGLANTSGSNDIMGENGGYFFANQTNYILPNDYMGFYGSQQLYENYPLWNYQDPIWPWQTDTETILYQNSYTYLQTVLGSGLNHPVAADWRVDPSYLSLCGNPASLAPGQTFSGAIARFGDSNVFSLSSPITQTVTINVTAPKGSTLNPVIMVYGDSGRSLLAETNAGQLQFAATAGVTYNLVVAGQDGLSSGAFNLMTVPDIQSGWTNEGVSSIQQIAVGHNHNGSQQLFTLSADGSLSVNNQYYVNNAAYWTGWRALGGPFKSMAVTEDASGQTQVFVVDNNGGLAVDTQRGADSWYWAGWQVLGGSGIKQVAVANNQNGLTDVFVVGSDNAVWFQTEDSSGNFHGWYRLPSWVSSIRVDRDGWGRLQVFAIGSDGGLWVASETAANSNSFSGFVPLGGYYNLTQLAVGNNQDGRCDVFAVGANGTVSYWWQDAMGNWDWGNFGTLPGNVPVQSIQIGHNTSGGLFVFAVGMDNHAWVIGQSALNGGFGSWVPLGGMMKQLAVNNDINGNLVLWGLSLNSEVYYR